MKKVKGQIHKRTLDTRLMVGIIVGLIVVAVIVIKVASGQRSTAGDGTTAEPANVSATATTSQVEADPYPSSPGLQVAWVERNKKPAMILYHSTNCIPCKAMDELVKKVHADYEPDLVFIDVITNDASNNAEVGRSGIRFIPTTFFVSISGEKNVVVGAMEEDALRAELTRLQAGN